MNCRFIYNLKKETADPIFRKWLHPSGYLLAPNNASPAMVKLATTVRSERKLRLFADNGNFALLQDIQAKFMRQSLSLYAQMQSVRTRLRREPRAEEIPEKVKSQYRKLAEDVSRDILIRSESILRGDNLARQLSYSPTDIIGAEDISVAVWLSLDIEPNYLGYTNKHYADINRNVAKRWKSDLVKLSVTLRDRCYAVASASSYDSAFEAGRAFAEAGIRRIAIGCGSFMHDNHFSDYLYMHGKRIDLPTTMPNRYVRTVAVACGFFDGYRKVLHKAPRGFHYLGLGAPALLPLAALCAWGTEDLTFDAMSPILDATEGTIYLSGPRFEKERTRELAFALASGQTSSWDCSCPFCLDFKKKYPFDYSDARIWFSKKKPPSVTADDLRPSGGLYKAFLLFAEPSGGQLRQAVTFARMGHNHWVVETIMAGIRKNSSSLPELRDYVRDMVRKYAEATEQASLARAIDYCYKLATNSRTV